MSKRTHEQTANKPPLCKGGKGRGDCKSQGIEERSELQEGFCNDKQSLSLNHAVQSAPFTQGSLQCGKTACGAAEEKCSVTFRKAPQSRSRGFVRGGACKGAQRAEEADFAAEERSCRKNIRSIRASGYSQSFRRLSGAALLRLRARHSRAAQRNARHHARLRHRAAQSDHAGKPCKAHRRAPCGVCTRGEIAKKRGRYASSFSFWHKM